MTTPRILAIMGSGETAPTMRGPHRAIFERLDAGTAARRWMRCSSTRRSGSRRTHRSSRPRPRSTSATRSVVRSSSPASVVPTPATSSPSNEACRASATPTGCSPARGARPSRSNSGATPRSPTHSPRSCDRVAPWCSRRRPCSRSAWRPCRCTRSTRSASTRTGFRGSTC